MNLRKFERVGEGLSKNGQPPTAHAAGTESGPVPNGTPPEQAFTVCGYWFPIFEKPILVKHFCTTNVGCSFLSRQSRFPDLEGKRQTILSTVQRGQK